MMNNFLIRCRFLAADLFDTKSAPINIPHVEPSQAKIQSIMTYIFMVMGAVSVLMITIAGVKYIMSMGNPQATAKAKDTILYAFIGLVVAVAGVAIIKFVVVNIAP